MVNGVNYYGNNAINSFAKQEFKERTSNASAEIAEVKEKIYTNIDKDKEFLSTCTDGNDDGKIGFKEGAKAFLGGVANHYLSSIENMKNFVKENPLKTAVLAGGALLIGGAAIAVFGAPVLLGIISCAGICFGVKGMVSSVKSAIENVKSAQNAQTDAQKKQALYGLGGNSAEFVDSAVAIYGGAKGLQKTFNAVSQLDDYTRVMAESTDDFAKNAEDLIKRIEFGDLSEEEIKILKEFLNNKESITPALIEILRTKTSISQNTGMPNLMSYFMDVNIDNI